jgi:DNA-directed RNA polymerase specialized sigma24 family protein
MTLRDLYILHAPTLAEPPLGEPVLVRELRKQTVKRRKVVELALTGLSPVQGRGPRGTTYREIGEQLGIAGGTVRSMLRETMAAIRKSALGLPRYHNVGRPRGRGYGRVKACAE